MLAVHGSARAYEDQLTAGVEAGYARVVSGAELPEHGPQLGLSTSWGFHDALSLRGRLAYAIHPADEPLHVMLAGAEVVYLLDVLEIVPYVGLGVGGIGTLFDGAFGADFAANLVLGLDWLVSWDWLVGIDVRPYYLPLALDSGLDPVYLTVTARVSAIFDLF